MINRRVLRAKALQGFFSFKQAEKANYNLALELIDEDFEPDLNSMIIPDKAELRRQAEKTKSFFDKWFSDRVIAPSADETVEASLKNAVDYYQSAVKKDVSRITKEIEHDIDEVFNEFLLLMSMIVELSDYVRYEDQLMQTKLREKRRSPHLNFLKDPVIDKIRQSEKFNAILDRHKLSWKDNEELIRKIFKHSLITDDEFKEYSVSGDSMSFDENKEFVKSIMSKALFMNESLDSFFEERDLHWGENKKIVKSLCYKALKGMTEKDAFELPKLSPNLEEDLDYFKKLFKTVVENDREFEEQIADYLKNWEVERVAETDKIIIKLALTEFINFPSIPVKVSINEYIELSKQFSTQKSKVFVNGVLDRMSKNLQDKGEIKKSGRGLIDNK